MNIQELGLKIIEGLARKDLVGRVTSSNKMLVGDLWNSLHDFGADYNTFTETIEALHRDYLVELSHFNARAIDEAVVEVRPEGLAYYRQRTRVF